MNESFFKRNYKRLKNKGFNYYWRTLWSLPKYLVRPDIIDAFGTKWTYRHLARYDHAIDKPTFAKPPMRVAGQLDKGVNPFPDKIWVLWYQGIDNAPEIVRACVSSIRNHGVTKDPELMTKNDGGWYYEMLDLGFNYRMTEMQAALGNSQLKRLDWSLRRRHEIAARYDEAFADIPEIKTPKTAEGFYHALHLYIIRVPDRKGLYDFLRANGVMVQIHYYPVNLQPYYLKLGNKRGDLPLVENYYEHCISLPMFPTLTEEEQEYTIAKVKEYICK
jgi:Predicted pyridoxal phosphate-dependent enzyme apparently involved in regulation of cell wall biogenesis